MDGWMDRWGSGSTSWWYNTVDGVDKDDGVGMSEYLGGDTREKETACERKGDSLVAISDNDVKSLCQDPDLLFLAVFSFAHISSMVTFKRHTFICTYIKLRGTHLPHISLPQV